MYRSVWEYLETEARAERETMALKLQFAAGSNVIWSSDLPRPEERFGSSLGSKIACGRRVLSGKCLCVGGGQEGLGGHRCSPHSPPRRHRGQQTRSKSYLAQPAYIHTLHWHTHTCSFSFLHIAIYGDCRRRCVAGTFAVKFKTDCWHNSIFENAPCYTYKNSMGIGKRSFGAGKLSKMQNKW